jgi:lipoprotein-anchoring transpeptidase ErfK/SrfK
MSELRIYLRDQRLDHLDEAGRLVRRYLVSTSRNGPGERNGSYCTPRGRHVVRAKIGAGVPANTVFVKRRPTGELYSPELAERFPGRDWILTRILWLSGCEPGFNRLGPVDTMRRFIYIHGTPDTTELGKPGSIGCVRMHNEDLIELFDRVGVGTPVTIFDAIAPHH